MKRTEGLDASGFDTQKEEMSSSKALAWSIKLLRVQDGNKDAI
jgi:hypothetical protein